MKVIFLDIDGVLNTERSIIQQCSRHKNTRLHAYDAQFNFDTEALKNLEKIVRVTDAMIVISSTWRISQVAFDEKLYLPDGSDQRSKPWEFWNAILKNLAQIKVSQYIIGVTPFYGGEPRGREIRAWLKANEHLGITHFVIIDDDADMEEFSYSNLAQCPGRIGIDHIARERAIDILTKE